MPLFRAVRAFLFPSPPIERLDDPVLGGLAWRASSESWLSEPVRPDGRFVVDISRHRGRPIPPVECLTVAREIAHDPARVEQLVRTQLVYEAERRPAEMRPRIIALRIARVTLRCEPGQVSGEFLLHGDPDLSNWSVWHVNGVPTQAAQHWE